MRFLLVEDSDTLSEAIQSRLGLDGHAVDRANTLSAAEACLAGAAYDMILLDLGLPDGDGRDFLRAHRNSGRTTPVIVLTARAQVEDRIVTLDDGADDYMTKPFDVAELEARCRAVLRRRQGEARNARRFGDVEFDPLASVLKIAGEEIALRNRELRLLEIFFAAPGRVFSKNHLADRLFSYDEDASENAIEVYVGRLRKKMEASAVRIETVRGVGYRMVAP